MSHAQFLPWLFAHASPTPTPSPGAAGTDPQVIAAIIAACAAVLTLIVTTAAQYLSRRGTRHDLEKQDRRLVETLEEQRTRTLNERFATAAGQLGTGKPHAVRLAGVYAMAGLADDWEQNRQTCVNVLCAYLRLPHDPAPGADATSAKQAAYRADREVRHTVIRVIAAHLRADMAKAKSWQGLNFDFTGVVFDGGDFGGAVFSGGTVFFSDARFSGGEVDARGPRIVVGAVSFGGARFSGGAAYFSGAAFTGGIVDFGFVEFSGGTVDFGGAAFTGGTIDFHDPVDWSYPPVFPWTGTPPPGGETP